MMKVKVTWRYGREEIVHMTMRQLRKEIREGNIFSYQILDVEGEC